MDSKVCTKCGVNKPICKYYKYKNRNGFRPNCRDCYNSWAREYGKRDSVKIKRNIKGDKWSKANLNSWRHHIPIEASCEVCGIKIWFNSKNINTSIHFDHKNEFCAIKSSPMQWLHKHSMTEKNKSIWDSCDFGMLCGKCNRYIPTKDRNWWLERLKDYICQ